MTQPPEAPEPTSEDPLTEPAADEPATEDPPAEPVTEELTRDEPVTEELGSAEPEPVRRRSVLKVAVVVAVALLVLGGAATGLYFLTRDDGSVPAGSPEDVREDYIRAYETKDFASVVREACQTYRKEFGTDTSKLENELERYDVSAKPWGPPEVSGDAATAYVDLELARRGDVERPRIAIHVVKEAGKWRFCGEERA